MSTAYETFNDNITRVRNIVEIYKKQTATRNSSGRTSTKETDILRSGVVCLHAALEEYLRTVILDICILKFKNGDIGTLEGVSLPCGDERPKQGARFCVKDLYDYRGKLVEEILEQSIREKIRFITFNNYKQVCHELAGVNIRINEFAGFKSLDDCIIRRHKIVHEADKNIQAQGRGVYRTSAINTKTLQAWIDAEVKFVALVEEQVNAMLLGERGNE